MFWAVRGAWKRAAGQSARLCQRDDLVHLPPSYAGLDRGRHLMLTSQMCECLEEVQWATCVVCRRTWLICHLTLNSLTRSRASGRLRLRGSTRVPASSRGPGREPPWNNRAWRPRRRLRPGVA